MIDAVSAKRISKTFRSAAADHAVLHDVTFCIKQGSSAAILGQARSGKTTLLHLLAGLEQPTTGSLKVIGNSLETLNDNDRASYRREVIGLVSPEVPWLPQFSLHDNVALPLLIANVSRRDAEKRVLNMCGLLELQPAQSISELSLLERYQWSLARGIIHSPKILLVDAVDDLDTDLNIFLDQLLDICSHQGLTVIIATRQSLVAAGTEQILVLKEGIIEPSKTHSFQDSSL
jgi:ABC-type lipoprotein export system ATPase subunit